MAEDRVVITADASEYFDVLNRAGAAADRFGARGAGIGDGFLRSERIVGRAAAGMTTSLFAVRDAADAAGTAGSLAATTLLSFERIGTVGIIAAVGLEVIGTAIAKIVTGAEEAKKATDDLNASLKAPFKGAGPDLIATQFEQATKALEEFDKKFNTLGAELARRFKDTNLNPFSAANRPGAAAAQAAAKAAAEEQLSVQRQKELNDLVTRYKVALTESVAIRRQEVEGDTELAARNKLILEGENKIAKIRATTSAPLLEDAVKAQQELNRLDLEELDLKQRTAEAERARAVFSSEITAKVAGETIGSGSEEKALAAAQAQIDLANEQLADAVALSNQSNQRKDLEEKVTIAMNEQIAAVANLRDLEAQIAFRDEQQLRAAEAGAEAAGLQRDNFDASAQAVLERAAAEEKVNALLKEGKTAIAEQVAQQAALNALKNVEGHEMSLLESLAQEDLKTTEQKYQDLQRNIRLWEAARAEAAQLGLPFNAPAPQFGRPFNLGGPTTAQQVADLGQARMIAEAFGGALQEVIAKAREAALQNQIKKAVEPTEGDFSGINSLAGKDFTGIASLASMDFSGLQSLNGLSISIA